ncbi:MULTISPECIES: SCO family protein [unclassified Comamonas]|uniref:SCO family protein n=1 Tax=unclassified Comamonas TaxID=2638500 RepID=UPI000A5491C2|nr:MULTISPECIES: SCO family protein [unclassified Comamonas]MBN9330390.1 SCO family protein [Comamonas sp.]
MHKRNFIKTIAAGALSVGAGAVFVACTEAPKPAFKGVDITGVDYARDLPLTDQFGQQRHLKDFAGKVVAVFFGYTNCPDVCPTTMSELAQVKSDLGAEGDRLQVLFVTVDPERDTPEVLKAYMAHFDPSFLALRGSPEELAAVAKDFKIFYKQVPGDTPTSYSMDHSAGMYMFDPKGQLRLFQRYGSSTQALVDDTRLLLDEKKAHG